jgi:hypothetical protein
VVENSSAGRSPPVAWFPPPREWYTKPDRAGRDCAPISPVVLCGARQQAYLMRRKAEGIG